MSELACLSIGHITVKPTPTRTLNPVCVENLSKPGSNAPENRGLINPPAAIAVIISVPGHRIVQWLGKELLLKFETFLSTQKLPECNMPIVLASY